MPDCTITEVLDEQGKRTGIYTAEREEYQVKLLPLTLDAKTALDDYGDALLLAVQGEQYIQLQPWYTRLRDKCLQIATSFALLQESPFIELKHIARAQQICELFRESLHKLVAYLNEGNTVGKASPEEKILRLLEEKGPLTVREVAQFTHFDVETVRTKLIGLVGDGDIIPTKKIKRQFTVLFTSKKEKEERKV